MALATGAALALGGLAAAKITGDVISAGAQSDIAKAQQAGATRQQALALQFAAPTSEELENIKRQTDLYTKMYGQQTSIINQMERQVVDAYGPAIMEAGKQYYNQLRGEASGVVKSFDEQRNRQRNQLRTQLIERMGPDALTSSAGVNALNDFDQKTSDMRASIEEQAMNNAVGRISNLQQAQGAAGATATNAYSGMSGLLELIQKSQGTIQQRQIGAITGTAEGMIRTAGSENVGRAATGRMISGLASEGLNIAGTAMMTDYLKGGDLLTGSESLQSPEFGSSSFDRPSYSDRFSLGVEGVSPGASAPRFGGQNTFGEFNFNTGGS